MSKAALKQLSDQLEQLQAEGQTDTEEYESLSDDYQSLAMSMLPTWTEHDDESE
ncbi:hypothetical protein [Marinobacterium sediminicola]|uniref:Uncharacterized protein n=1 Tax=Marinobacterium sediminicola TaxID=518898 RepID=A0ABY1S238_9GAMM|nr:hypothetical protein [Marinobacterium sediminicola]ULG68546.1 hypothetical protein LN244_12685 [Marinobacterium sediminicola]SMR76592.1 hypothetical protein SAMN04487964_1127 [Marinobacterium sediminicola]